MLGKVIAWGADREAARADLVDALDDTAILGLTTNPGFLRALAASDEFRDATIDTAWLDHAEVPAPDRGRPAAAGRLGRRRPEQPALRGQPGGRSPPTAGARRARTRRRWWRSSTTARCTSCRSTVAARTIDGEPVREQQLADHVAVLAIDGRDEMAFVNAQAHSIEVSWHGQRFVFERPDPFADHGPAVGDGTLVAPMPGTVLDVRVAVGQQVAEGETLGAMEAMKMELALKAPFAGTVTEVDVAAGQQVALGATLFVVEGSR